MSSTMVRVLHACSHLISQQTNEVDTVIILTYRWGNKGIGRFNNMTQIAEWL